MKKHFTSWLSCGALALLPFTLPAATIPISFGEICWDTEDPNPTDFPNGFVAYNVLCDMWLQVGANPGSGGFSSLDGQDGSLLSFSIGGLELTSFSPPDTVGPIFLEYTSDYPFTAVFLRDNGVDYDGFVIGQSYLRFEADAFPTPDGQHQMRVSARITLDFLSHDDPLAEAFYAELMELTDNTGNLYLNTLATLNVDGSLSFGATELSTVPEPGAVAAILATAALALSLTRRKLRQLHPM